MRRRRWALGVGAWALVVCACDHAHEPSVEEVRESVAVEPPEPKADEVTGCGPGAETALRRINELRALSSRTCGSEVLPTPRRPLTANRSLQCAAAQQSRGMATLGYFAHDAPDRSTPQSRAASCGFRAVVGENISWGQVDFEGAIDSWIQSPGHCRNMFDGQFTYAGFSCSRSKDGKAYWALVMGAAH
jgi:uncharacterized protein YkwD